MSPIIQKGKLRIIGGQWKSRTIQFVGPLSLRPTPDSVRETLFNWLMPVINKSNCLDLFSGSGALGFEAVSRGASRADLVENNKSACQQLIRSRDELCAQQVYIHCENVLDYLSSTTNTFDIVFIDPPFDCQIASQVVKIVQQSGILKSESLIYIEQSKEKEMPRTPSQWQLHRRKTNGRILSLLYKSL
ncbi:MAG: 16S rRNA (guanine(966)-N(2))-methyltransferase RsmD [Acidiferrobacteraceae bacterium]|mgnify:CR=1 FL=1|nr:16S rRNA (guanine(966)-N(2))-methyltransferase RsmD [Acidiferrobacteraceae bacterium]|tara:strand:- start:438 stop:1004 length:567 start_codon:yes stop_codon:yes gene_type:complete